MFPQSRRSDSRSPPIGLGCLAAWSVPIDARRRRKSTPDSPGESVGWLLRKASRYSHFPVQRLNKPNILRAGADGQAYPIVLANGPEMATSFLGVAGAAVCAPLNPNYVASEF